MGKLIRKHMKTMISTLKSLILINFVKKNRLAAGPLPGVTLGGGQPPAARCAGAKMRQKNSKTVSYIFLDTISPLEHDFLFSIYLTCS